MGSSVNRSLQAKFNKQRRGAASYSFDRSIGEAIDKCYASMPIEVRPEVEAFSHWSLHFDVDAPKAFDVPVVNGKWRA